jgi:hypothetical protein
MVTIMPDKTKLLSSLIPGDLSTYIYNTEEDFYNEYKTSMFAMTMKKAGWDCMRHYEILACGTVPYFVDIEACPQNTMALLPKQLFIDAKALYERLEHIPEFSETDTAEYFELRNRLYVHTKNHLTTKAMASYILDTVNQKDAKRIFCIYLAI